MKVQETQYKPVYNPEMTVPAERRGFTQSVKCILNSPLSLCFNNKFLIDSRESSTENFKSEMLRQIGCFFATGLNSLHLNENKESVVEKFATHIENIDVLTPDNVEKTKAIANELNGIISPLVKEETKEKLEEIVRNIVKKAEESNHLFDVWTDVQLSESSH